MARSLEARCRRLVATLGLGRAEDVGAVTPLTGGVASDIAVVELPENRVCVKFALAKLRVAAEWRAPVHRNLAEYQWLDFAGRVVPTDDNSGCISAKQAMHHFLMVDPCGIKGKRRAFAAEVILDDR